MAPARTAAAGRGNPIPAPTPVATRVAQPDPHARRETHRFTHQSQKVPRHELDFPFDYWPGQLDGCLDA
jgi:hypothetical protein